MYFNFSVRILSYFDLIKNQHEGYSNHIHITERCRSQIFFTFIYLFFYNTTSCICVHRQMPGHSLPANFYRVQRFGKADAARLQLYSETDTMDVKLNIYAHTQLSIKETQKYLNVIIVHYTKQTKEVYCQITLLINIRYISS